jgi:hypothetical protein
MHTKRLDLPRIETIPAAWGEAFATPEEYTARAAEAGIPELKSQMKAGELPGFIIDRKVVQYLFGPSFWPIIDKNNHTPAFSTEPYSRELMHCFEAIDRIFGPPESVRSKDAEDSAGIRPSEHAQ